MIYASPLVANKVVFIRQENVMPSSRFLFLNVGHSIDHLFMLMFPAVAALAAADLSASYGEVLKLATGSFIAFGVFSLPMGWLADRLSRELHDDCLFSRYWCCYDTHWVFQ